MSTTSLNPKKSRSAWPYVIIGVFLSFFLYISFFVSQAMKSEVNLVSKNYYQEELAYQQHIDVLNRSARRNQNVAVVAPAGLNQVIINIPGAARAQVTGSINFFRPSDAKQDFQVPVKLNESGNQVLNTEKLAKGRWRVKISYTQGQEHLYNETQITLN